MSITLKLYNCPSPTNCVNKTLNDGDGGNLLKTVNAKVNGVMNRTDPVFTVDCDSSTAAALGNCNYLIAGAPLNRNYFVVSIDFTIAKTAVITCHVDLLTTFSSRLDATTLNYIRGWGDITEMEDSSYPISDYMVEQWYNLQSWTDIFSNEGSQRQYLLRTIAAPDVAPTVVELTQSGQVFWDFGHTYVRESDNATMYVCYQFNEIVGETFAPLYVPRQDITGIISINNGNFVSLGGNTWKWNSKEAAMMWDS